MNKEIGYITSAHLILAAGFACYLFFSSIQGASVISADQTNNEQVKEDPVITDLAKKGKSLFQGKCASCHSLTNDITGPALAGFEQRGPWADRNQLYKWIRNPEAFMKIDPYTQKLKKRFGNVMTAFPSLTDEEIDSIVEYIN